MFQKFKLFNAEKKSFETAKHSLSDKCTFSISETINNKCESIPVFIRKIYC